MSPLRDFLCKKCGHKITDVYFSKESDLEIKECSICGGTEFEKLIPVIGGVIFKGKGWTGKSNKEVTPDLPKE